jgi:hypothetical protein
MKKLIWLLFCLIVSLCGCASTINPRQYAEKREWHYAYSAIDTVLTTNPKVDPKQFIELTRQYPEIIDYWQQGFSYERLSKVALQINDLTSTKNQLTRFCTVAPVEQCTEANNNLVEAEKLIKKELRLRRDLFAGLNIKEQKSLSDNYKIIFYETSEIGIVTDRQVRNLSTPGSNFGAEAGGAAGAVAYVNNVNPANYSLSKDVSSTLLGAFVGAALFNKQAVEQYEIRYTVKLRNGDLKQFDVLSSTPLADGIGVCIGMPYGTKVDQSLCTMTLAEFRDKFAGELKN